MFLTREHFHLSISNKINKLTLLKKGIGRLVDERTGNKNRDGYLSRTALGYDLNAPR